MKKMMTMLICVVIAFSMVGCGEKSAEKIIEGNMKAYSEMPDKTWEYEGNTYKYRLEISDTMPNTDKVITFVYLSNLEEITFEQAMKASEISSNMADYFDPKDAVLVEVK